MRPVTRTRFSVLLSLFVFGPILLAQVKLVPTEPSVIQAEWARALEGPTRCDVDRNYYFRPYEMGGGVSPVLRTNPSGDKVTKLSFDNDPTLRRGTLQDFTIAPDGVAYELIQVGNDVYIASFSGDGSYASKILLSEHFWGAHLAASTKGSSFLVAGSELPAKNGPPPKMFTGLFDAAGRLVRRIQFSADPAQIDPDKTIEVTNYFGDKAMLPLILGDAETDTTGNTYVLRASSPPVIFVLDASGDLARKIQIKPPQPGMQMAGMHVRNGMIASLLQKVDEEGRILDRLMIITDAATGAEVAQYVVPDNLGVAFACYTGNAFGFITESDGKLAVQTARPQ